MAGFLDLSALLQRKKTFNPEVNANKNTQERVSEEAAKSSGSAVNQQTQVNEAVPLDYQNNERPESALSKDLEADKRTVDGKQSGVVPEGMAPQEKTPAEQTESADISSRSHEEALWSPRHVEDKGVIVEERNEGPAEVMRSTAHVTSPVPAELAHSNGSPVAADVTHPSGSPVHQSSGRLSKVGGLLKKTLSLSRGGKEEHPVENGHGVENNHEVIHTPTDGEEPPGDTSSPRVTRRDSKVRTLLKKITPGEDLQANGGEESPSVRGGEPEKCPGIVRQSSGRFQGLKRLLSGNHSGIENPQKAPVDLVSLFRIPEYLLPGRGASARTPTEGAGTPPGSPIVAFLDSQADEHENEDLRKELTAILGTSQVFDVAHLPAADFLDALLSSIHERARTGDRIAETVKDGLRILVIGEDALFKAVRTALHESRYGHIPVGCLSTNSSSTVAQALGLTYGGKIASYDAAMQILWQVASAGSQSMDCWAMKLSTHRKRMPSTLPSSFENVSAPQEGRNEWILSYRSLFWSSLRVDMGYANGYKEGGDGGASRKSSGWLCCAQPPKVIGSQNVGRLEIRKDGSWCYLELSPKIQTVEFVNLMEGPPRARRKMKMLEKGRLDAFSDDGLIEIVGIQEGSDVEICLAQTNAVRLELFGNADIDHARLTMDSDTWTQSLAGEMTAHPATIEISHGGQALVLVTHSTSLKCVAPPVFPPPLVPDSPSPLEKPRKRSPSPFRRASGFLRSPSPFRASGFLRSPSSFRRARKRSQSPDPRRSDVPERHVAPSEPSDSMQTPSEPSKMPSEAPAEEREGRQSENTPRKRAQSSPRVGRYADVATAAAAGGGLAARRPNATIPWTLKVDKQADVEKVQPQQKVGRSPSGSARHAEIVEPLPKILVRTGSTGDGTGRNPSPSLYRSASRENLDQAISSRPPSPALYRSSSRENLERHSSPSLSRQNSGNTGYSPRVNMMHLPRSESPVHFHSHTIGSHSREPTPERMPRMADWAAGTSRKTFNTHQTYSGGAHSHLLTKQEREQAVAIGLGGTLTRDERERMQSLAFGGAYGLDRASTPYRIRSARARYGNPVTVSYQSSGPLELDLATPHDGGKSPPPPVRTARDYFSGPLMPRGLPSVRRSHA